MSTNEIAWQIFEALQKAGAGIGNASVPIIKRVLDEAAQQSVQPTDGGLAQADGESNPPTISG